MSRSKKTETSSFGVSARVNHDSTKFYNSRLYKSFEEPEKPDEYNENVLPRDRCNKIYCKDSRSMSELPDNSVHLMITSPPYNVGKDYDQNLSLREYLDLMEKVFQEVFRVLVWGGRACINVANLGRKPYLPLHAYITQIMIDIGYLMRGEIIWDKGSSSGVSTAWGSWRSPSNPILRDTHEYILIFSKGSFSRLKPKSKETSISKQEFLEFTKSVWHFSAESAKKVNHPAPFPVELPYRLIQLYSYKNDVILDPFCGSGTTCLAAKKTERFYVGYDIDAAYVENARKRLQQIELPLIQVS
ncbi:MAG: site-specific DNA-methyltransferase [Calditrichaeota bacterium]|nr:site-specific DNA-methyltransferase [Calditrichota bacterium]